MFGRKSALGPVRNAFPCISSKKCLLWAVKDANGSKSRASTGNGFEYFTRLTVTIETSANNGIDFCDQTKEISERGIVPSRHPILVTLGTMTAVKGIAVYATSGGVIGGFPPAILFLGNGILLGVPVPMILFILCAIVVAVIMSHAPFGVAVRMIGSNEKATRYSGVATDWMLVGVYVVSSLLCWVAAVVMMARFNSARAGYAESYLLITILAAVLGGVDPNGGFGKVLGLFLSLVLLQIISTGFNLMGVSPHLTEAIWGATMILAIALALVRDRWVARLWLGKT
jgi:ribose/xylose/arabinose/galactoside ABC-type transport system permease subunit